MQSLIIFVFIILIAYLINYFLSHSFLGKRWRIFVAPGVIFHELCHALACIVCFARITKISFFDKDGGSVTHQKSPIPLIGPIIISSAPLMLGILAFYFLAKQIQLNNPVDISMIYFNFKTIIQTIDFTSWQNILIIYLLMSVAVTMTPSREDLMNMLFPLVIVVAIFYLLIKFTSLDVASFNNILQNLLPILMLAAFFLVGILIIGIVFYTLTLIIFKK